MPILFQGAHFTWCEVGWGSVLAALSIGGQLAMAVALELNVPGHIVFPIAIGGSVFIVILGGRLLFGERLNKLTAGGVLFGLAAVILLSLSQSELRERRLRIWHEDLEAVQLVKLST